MAEEETREEEQVDLAVPEMWRLAKPPVEAAEDGAPPKRPPGPLIGKLVKLLNDIEDQEEFDTKIQELDPATGHSLLAWATLTGKFVLVEWLVKKGKRAAFAFNNTTKEMTVYDKWIEIRKELEDKAREALEHPPEETEAEEEGEEKAPEPTADQMCFEALSDLHEEWGPRGPGIVKRVGELGVFQGARSDDGTKTGLGQTLFPNGDAYVGEYHDNSREGTGTYWFEKEGAIYTGHWHNNVRHGIGRMVYADGGRYYGEWLQDKRNGEGRYTYPDGSSFSGTWVRDVTHGSGTLSFKDGSEYVGTFVDGEFTSGEWRLAGGTRYYGNFSNGVPVGKGVFVFKYGREGSYRQQGSFVKGIWQPGAISATDDVPQLEISIQNKPVMVIFTNECAGFATEQLLRAVNFGPVLSWLRTVEANDKIFVESLQVAGLATEGANVSEVRLKVAAIDAEGRRLRGTDQLIFRAPTSRLLVILSGGDKTVALLQQTPRASLGQGDQLLLPTVTAAPRGAFAGKFCDLVQPALRLQLSPQHCIPLGTLQGVRSSPHTSNASHTVFVYIQQIHADAMAALQRRLDDACASSPFLQVRAVRLTEVATLSCDALTVLAAHAASAMIAESRLPNATVEAQRPPTPLPPAPEPRPDIEPLLEAERKKEAAAKKAEEEAPEE